MRGKVSLETWMRYAADHTNHVHIVTAGNRPGAMSFAGLVEYRYFTPGTPPAAGYGCAAVPWSGLDWVVISFPKHRLEEARSIAIGLCMKLVVGWPSVKQAGVTLQFPGRGSNVRTLENDFRQPVYNDLKRDQAAILQREQDVMQYLGTGKPLMPAQVLEYIYRDGVLPGWSASASKH